ncbi:signal peptidase I [Deinococcus pimensis]|uniref:signal peptidase I n=1 Tax=Deinococcus pimensis TaxID=309888 RepID=UPI000487938A|nr:signal peptidase I [Deinococcus pimensis]
MSTDHASDASTPAAPAGRSRSAAVTFLREWVLGAALPIWLVATFLVMFARVDGTSMNPTYESGDRLILWKLPRWLHAWGLRPDWPRRGDVVVFKAPPGHPESYETGPLGLRYRPYLIKRVVGLPGDRIEVRGGLLYRNGERVAESYTTGEAGRDEPPVTVPPRHVFVMGDNRRLGESVDSRDFGPVRDEDMAGMAGPRFWHAPSE